MALSYAHQLLGQWLAATRRAGFRRLSSASVAAFGSGSAPFPATPRSPPATPRTAPSTAPPTPFFPGPSATTDSTARPPGPAILHVPLADPTHLRQLRPQLRVLPFQRRLVEFHGHATLFHKSIGPGYIPPEGAQPLHPSHIRGRRSSGRMGTGGRSWTRWRRAVGRAVGGCAPTC